MQRSVAMFVSGLALLIACELDTAGSGIGAAAASGGGGQPPIGGSAGTAAASGGGGISGGAAGAGAAGASGGVGAEGGVGGVGGVAGSDSGIAGSGAIGGTAGTAGTDGGAVLPTDIQGDLELWLRADLGVTETAGLVSGWADQSGKNHHYAQTDAAFRPQLVATAIGGKPSVRFANGPKFLTGGSFSYAGGATLFLVARLAVKPAANEYFELFDLQAPATSTRVGFTGAPAFEQLYFGVSGALVRAPSPANDTAPHLYEITWNGGPGEAPASYTLSVDGTPASLVAATSSAFAPKTAIGAFVDNLPAHFRGAVGEIVVFGNVLSTADRAALRASMAAFWGVP
jgi:hypothetical protein